MIVNEIKVTAVKFAAKANQIMQCCHTSCRAYMV